MTSKIISTNTWSWPVTEKKLGKLCGLLGGQQSVALLPKVHKGEVVQALILMGGPIQGSCPDEWYSVQDPEEPKNKDDGGTYGRAHTLSGNHLRWAALRREQLDKLEGQSMSPNPRRKEGWMPRKLEEVPTPARE
jgi:hypothetical protein